MTGGGRTVQPGYHLGGLLLHDPAVAVAELAWLGFAAVAVRPIAGRFSVGEPNFQANWQSISAACRDASVDLILDLDAAFVFDPHIDRPPSWTADDLEQRDAAVDWIAAWMDATAGTAGLATIRSGRVSGKPDAAPESWSQIVDVVAERTEALYRRVEGIDLPLAIRPAAGDTIATVGHWTQIAGRIGEDRMLLAADVGEMVVAGEFPIGDRLTEQLDALACVYVCDRGSSTGGVNRRDIRIGHGELATERIIQTLDRGGYDGPAVYRVLGHDADGLLPAREAIDSFESVR